VAQVVGVNVPGLFDPTPLPPQGVWRCESVAVLSVGGGRRHEATVRFSVDGDTGAEADAARIITAEEQRVAEAHASGPEEQARRVTQEAVDRIELEQQQLQVRLGAFAAEEQQVPSAARQEELLAQREKAEARLNQLENVHRGAAAKRDAAAQAANEARLRAEAGLLQTQLAQAEGRWRQLEAEWVARNHDILKEMALLQAARNTLRSKEWMADLRRQAQAQARHHQVVAEQAAVPPAAGGYTFANGVPVGWRPLGDVGVIGRPAPPAGPDGATFAHLQRVSVGWSPCGSVAADADQARAELAAKDQAAIDAKIAAAAAGKQVLP
jgi:hypothetical protein